MDISGLAVLYTGRLSPEKHVDVCLRAFAVVRQSLPDAIFLIAGQGAAQDKLKQLAQELGLVNSVRFLGFVTPGDLVALYQVADIFAIASTAETQCLSMMQAFACGLPAVAVRAGGLPEYLPDAAGFLVPVGDVDALADKIKFLLTDSETRRRYGEQALKFVQQYSAPRIMQEWVALFSEFVSKRPVK